MTASTPYQQNKISLIQFICILSGIQIGVAVLTLPGDLAQAAGTDGWMAIILGWVLVNAVGFITIALMRRSPHGTILELLSERFGARAGKLAALLLGLYFLYLAFDGLSRTVLITKTWLLPNTSTTMLMLLILIPCYVIARHHLTAVGRYVVLVFMLALWVPIVYLLPLEHGHILNLLPLFKSGIWPIVTATKVMIYPGLGMSAALIMYPYLKHKRQATIGILISNTVTMGLYLYITVICFLFYSPDEILQFNEPVISVLMSIEFRFVERIEVLFIAFYIFFFSMVWVPCMYLTTHCTSWMTGRKDNRLHLICLSICIALFTWFMKPTFAASDYMKNLLTYVGLVYEYILPSCLIGLLWAQARFRAWSQP